MVREQRRLVAFNPHGSVAKDHYQNRDVFYTRFYRNVLKYDNSRFGKIYPDQHVAMYPVLQRYG